MYRSLKKILKTLLTKNKLFEFELFFRNIYSIFYFGNNVYCNICESNFSKYIEIDSTLICPKCGSSSRSRHLFSYLNNLNLGSNQLILDFSPTRALYRKLKNLFKQNYIASDFSGEFIADQQYDITNLDCKDNSFDLIICFHILEHIIEDNKAMKEMFRVLKPNAFCLIQTPFKSGDIYEDYSIIDPIEREKHFGQSDHVRIYSIDGLNSRLKEVGFETNVINFEFEFQNKNGFSTINTIVVAKKHSF